MKALLLLARPHRLTRRLASALGEELRWRGFDVETAAIDPRRSGPPLDAHGAAVVVLVAGAGVVPKVRTALLDDPDRLLGAVAPLRDRPVAALIVSLTGARAPAQALHDAIRRHGGIPLPVVHASVLGGGPLVDLAAECMGRVPPLRRGRARGRP